MKKNGFEKPNKVVITYAATSASTASPGKVRGKGGDGLKTLKAVKSEQEAEKVLLLIKKQIHENDSLKKSYLDKGIIDEILEVLEMYGNTLPIKFNSLALINELIYDVLGKEKMVKKGMHDLVMKMMNENKDDHHILLEGCRFLKKIAIKSAFAPTLVSSGARELVRDVVSKSKSDLDLSMEGIRCLKHLLLDDLASVFFAKFGIKKLIENMKVNKLKMEVQLECMVEILQYLNNYTDLDFMFECEAIQVIFNMIKLYPTIKMRTYGLDIINRCTLAMHTRPHEQRMQLAAILIEALNENNDSISINIYCFKLLQLMAIDEDFCTELISRNIDRIIATKMNCEFAKAHEIEDLHVYEHLARRNGFRDVYLMYNMCILLSTLSKYPKICQHLVENNHHNTVILMLSECIKLEDTYTERVKGEPFDVVESLNETSNSTLLKLLNSPRGDIVALEANKIARLIFRKDAYSLKCRSSEEASLITQICQMTREKHRIATEAFANGMVYLIEHGTKEMDLVTMARLLDQPVFVRFLCDVRMHIYLAFKLHNMKLTEEHSMLAIFIIATLIDGLADNHPIFNELRTPNIEVSARYVLRTCTGMHPILYETPHPIDHYCKEILRRYPGNEEFLEVKTEQQTQASASSIKSAASVRRE